MAAVGYVVAIPLRPYKEKLGFLGKILSVIVLSLVFSMGFKIGSNEEVIANFKTIGLSSLAFSIIPLLATIFSIRLTRKWLGFNHEGIYCGKGQKAPLEPVQTTAELEEEAAPKKKGSIFGSSTFRIGLAVFAGFSIGYLTVIKLGVIDFEVSNSALGTFITYALYVMVFFACIDLGLDGTIIEKFKQMGPMIIAFIAATGISTLIAVFIVGIFTPFSFKEILAIGCTFCWYSLGPNIIMDAGLIDAGAVAFLSNFFRVILSLFTVSLVAKKVGYLETTGMPMAASMDVCIATIQRETNQETAMVAFVSGAIYTALVPMVVPLIVA